MWDRLSAFDLTASAGWWWPHREFVMVADRPGTLSVEQVAPTGWGSHRMHAEHGPAIGWATDALFFWHGQQIPADPDEIRGWDVDRVLAERNTETRRALIEIIGWDTLTSHLHLVAECDDPGNAGQMIALYDLPPSMGAMYAQPARILLCTNGTEERSGVRRRYGLPVPARHTDPVAAAADLYGWPESAYRQLARRA